MVAPGKGLKVEAADTSGPMHLDHAGEDRLVTFFSALFERMSGDELGDFVKWLDEMDRTIRIGTVCSGTDSPVLVLRAMKRTLERMGVDITVSHAYSCEASKWKRQFIARMFPELDSLFMNVHHLVSSDGKAPNHLHPRQHPNGTVTFDRTSIPRLIDFLVAGFPCVDFSTLNPNHTSNSSAISDGSGRSGGVFAAIVEMVRLHQIKFMLLENVVNMAKRSRCKMTGQWKEPNSFALQRILATRCDMLTIIFALQPHRLGTPQSRGRLWMICIHRSVLRQHGWTDLKARKYCISLRHVLLCILLSSPLRHVTGGTQPNLA